MCKACAKAAKDPGAATVSCDYPASHGKRKRQAVKKIPSSSAPVANTIEDDENGETGDEETRTKEKHVKRKGDIVEGQAESRSQDLWDGSFGRDFGPMSPSNEWFGSSSTTHMPAAHLTTLQPSGMQLSMPPTEFSAIGEGPIVADRSPAIEIPLHTPPLPWSWGQTWTEGNSLQQLLLSSDTFSQQSGKAIQDPVSSGVQRARTEERSMIDKAGVVESSSKDVGRQAIYMPVAGGGESVYPLPITQRETETEQKTEQRRGEKLRVPYFRQVYQVQVHSRSIQFY